MLRRGRDRKNTAVVCTLTRYGFLDKRRNGMDQVTRGDNKWADIEVQELEVTPSVRNKEMRTVRQVVTLNKQLTTVDPIENWTVKIPMALIVHRKIELALDTRPYDALGSSLLDYSILAQVEQESGELTIPLEPKPTVVSVAKNDGVAARTPATPKTIGIAHGSAFPSVNDQVRYTKFLSARASPTIVKNNPWQQLYMLMKGGSKISMMREEITRE